MINKTMPLNTLGWAVVRLDRHKSKVGGLKMLIMSRSPSRDNTAAPPQTADRHLEQKGISITMPNRQQLHIHTIYTPLRSSCSAGFKASIAHLFSNNDISLIVGDIFAHHSSLDAKTEKAND